MREGLGEERPGHQARTLSRETAASDNGPVSGPLSTSGGRRALSHKLLDRRDRTFDARELVPPQIVQETLDRLDAHGPAARECPQTSGCGVDPNDAAVLAIDPLSRHPGPFHFAHQSAHRRWTHLLGGREGTEGLRTAHEHGERRQLSRGDTGQGIGAPSPPQEVDGRRVKTISDVATVCAAWHVVILVSKAN